MAEARARRSLPTWVRCGAQLIHASSIGPEAFILFLPLGWGYIENTQFEVRVGYCSPPPQTHYGAQVFTGAAAARNLATWGLARNIINFPLRPHNGDL